MTVETLAATALMPNPLGSFIAIDLGVHRNGRLTDIGAVESNGPTFRRKPSGARQASAALEELDRFCKDCKYLPGPNLIDHDQTIL